MKALNLTKMKKNPALTVLVAIPNDFDIEALLNKFAALKIRKVLDFFKKFSPVAKSPFSKARNILKFSLSSKRCQQKFK